tara:strand:+ start:333 stop:1169 length:837 start_codon:yes stop_codon:yes gene_type:complete
MNNLNILQNFDKKFYFSKPFPYFVIEKCFPDKIYEMLFKDYTLIINYLEKKNDTKNLNNIRLQINSKNFFKEDALKKTIWYDFIKYHTSKEFLNELVNIFNDDLNIYYPKILSSFKNYNNDKNFLKVRDKINNNHKFVIDCQPGINTSVIKKSNVRGPHVDNPVEIFGGLFYLRDDNDISDGGDLEIYDSENRKIYFEGKAEVKNKRCLKKVKTYKYGKNKCIFFLNSLKTIHGISARSETNFTRNLTNFAIETYFFNRLFDIERGGIKNLLKKIFKR